MILCDWQIAELATKQDMISPFVPESIKTEIDYRLIPDEILLSSTSVDIVNPVMSEKKVISYGLSSFGVDLRLRPKVKLFTNIFNKIVDPKNFDEQCAVDIEPNPGEDFIIIPANSFILAETLEYLKMPDNVLGLVQGKSTLARCGLNILVTPIEPGFIGSVVIEISNTTPNPVKLYLGEGCCQMILFQGERPNVTYSDRAGKYQYQEGITLPRV